MREPVEFNRSTTVFSGTARVAAPFPCGAPGTPAVRFAGRAVRRASRDAAYLLSRRANVSVAPSSVTMINCCGSRICTPAFETWASAAR